MNSSQQRGRDFGAAAGRAAASPFAGRKARVWLAFVLLALLLPVWPPRAQEATFVRHRLPIGKEIAEFYHFDLTENGHQELLVVELDRGVRNPVPHLTVYVRKGKDYVPVPDAAGLLPADLAMLGVGRFPFGPGLVLLVPHRLEIWPWREGRFVPDAAIVMDVESIYVQAGGNFGNVYVGPVAGGRTGLEWLVDFNGDGFHEIVVPRLDGLEILKVDASGALKRHVRLLTRSKSRLWFYLRENFMAYNIPAVRFLELNQAGWKDVVAYSDGLLRIFYLEEQPQRRVRMPDVVRDLQPPKPFDPKAPRDPPLKLVRAEDLNADGSLDLVFLKVSAADSAVSTSSRVIIYYGAQEQGGKSFALADKPDQVFAAEGFAHPILVDINGDGRTDLALVNVEIGFWTMVKALIARTVSAETAFYLMPKTGRYPREPDDVVDYSVKFSLGRFSHQPITTFGDFNGDGRPDLVLSVNKESLGIHWGLVDDFWDNDYDFLLEDFLPTRAKGVRVADLDGDGRDDLIFVYNRNDIRQMPEVNHKFTVLLSRFGTPKQKMAGSP